MKKNKRFIPVVLWISFMTFTSSFVISSQQLTQAVVSQSPFKMTEEEFGNFWHKYWWLFVKGFHVFEFFVLILFMFNAFPKKKALVFIITLALAIVDEWHQTFVADRGGRLSDVMIDWSGVVFGTIAYVIWQRRKQCHLTT